MQLQNVVVIRLFIASSKALKMNISNNLGYKKNKSSLNKWFYILVNRCHHQVSLYFSPFPLGPEWVNEWMSEGMSEWASERVNEWVSGGLTEWWSAAEAIFTARFWVLFFHGYILFFHGYILVRYMEGKPTAWCRRGSNCFYSCTVECRQQSNWYIALRIWMRPPHWLPRWWGTSKQQFARDTITEDGVRNAYIIGLCPVRPTGTGHICWPLAPS